MTARFGPAGNSESFYAAGNKATLQAPAWLGSLGLNAYEYQCGRGVRVTADTAHAMGEEARKYRARAENTQAENNRKRHHRR